MANAWSFTRRIVAASVRPMRVMYSFTRSLAYIVRSPVRARYPGAQKNPDTSRVAIFVNFDRTGVIHDYAIYHCKALNEAGLAVLFVSSSPRLDADSLQRLKPYVWKIMHRKNVGYDFGAYHDGINELGDLSGIDLLVLTNDSVYGPFFDLAPIIERCDDTADVWGLTDCWDIRWHLQSYFLVFRRSALRSLAFHQFWRWLLYVSDRQWVIRYREVRLSRVLGKSGLRLRAVFTFRDARHIFLEQTKSLAPAASDQCDHRQRLELIIRQTRDGFPLNSTHAFWWVLFQMGYPYFKRDLITANPCRIPYLYRWNDLLQQLTSYDIDLIDRHLRQSGTKVIV